MWPFEEKEEAQNTLLWLWDQIMLCLGLAFISFLVVAFLTSMFDGDEPDRSPVFIPNGPYSDESHDEEEDCYTDWDGRNNPTVCD